MSDQPMTPEELMAIRDRAMNHLPSDLFDRIDALGVYAPTHPRKPECAAALLDLRGVLAVGNTAALPDVLRAVAGAYSRNIAGQMIPPRLNWVRRTALWLADEVDAWKGGAA